MPSINSHKTPEQRAADQEACRRLAEQLAAQPLSDRGVRIVVERRPLLDFLEQPPLSAHTMILMTLGALREDILDPGRKRDDDLHDR
jgi:hypothetical protein